MPSVSSVEEASAFLRAATREGRRVRIGEDLTTGGLDRLLEHEAGDLTATVEAGIRLSALNARLAESGQRLSLDPPGDPTIGAIVAANLSGPLRHRFGTIRDLILGVTVVLADGTVANAGGKVVKNVAGYDLGKLLCGSRGTLGLIARVSLRLHPLPKAHATHLGQGDLAALRASQLVPSAVDANGRLALLFEGSARGVEAQLATAALLFGGGPTEDDVWTEVRARPRERREPPEPVRRLEQRLRAQLDPAGTLL